MPPLFCLHCGFYANDCRCPSPQALDKNERRNADNASARVESASGRCRALQRADNERAGTSSDSRLNDQTGPSAASPDANAISSQLPIRRGLEDLQLDGDIRAFASSNDDANAQISTHEGPSVAARTPLPIQRQFEDLRLDGIVSENEPSSSPLACGSESGIAAIDDSAPLAEPPEAPCPHCHGQPPPPGLRHQFLHMGWLHVGKDAVIFCTICRAEYDCPHCVKYAARPAQHRCSNPICRMRLASAAGLENHETQTHTRARTVCRICHGAFKYIKRHCRKVHPDRPLQDCLGGVLGEADGGRNRFRVPPGRVAHCGICAATFDEQRHLRRHLMDVHRRNRNAERQQAAKLPWFAGRSFIAGLISDASDFDQFLTLLNAAYAGTGGGDALDDLSIAGAGEQLRELHLLLIADIMQQLEQMDPEDANDQAAIADRVDDVLREHRDTLWLVWESNQQEPDQVPEPHNGTPPHGNRQRRRRRRHAAGNVQQPQRPNSSAENEGEFQPPSPAAAHDVVEISDDDEETLSSLNSLDSPPASRTESIDDIFADDASEVDLADSDIEEVRDDQSEQGIENADRPESSAAIADQEEGTSEDERPDAGPSSNRAKDQAEAPAAVADQDLQFGSSYLATLSRDCLTFAQFYRMVADHMLFVVIPNGFQSAAYDDQFVPEEAGVGVRPLHRSMMNAIDSGLVAARRAVFATPEELLETVVQDVLQLHDDDLRACFEANVHNQQGTSSSAELDHEVPQDQIAAEEVFDETHRSSSPAELEPHRSAAASAAQPDDSESAGAAEPLFPPAAEESLQSPFHDLYGATPTSPLFIANPPTPGRLNTSSRHEEEFYPFSPEAASANAASLAEMAAAVPAIEGETGYAAIAEEAQQQCAEMMEDSCDFGASCSGQPSGDSTANDEPQPGPSDWSRPPLSPDSEPIAQGDRDSRASTPESQINDTFCDSEESVQSNQVDNPTTSSQPESISIEQPTSGGFELGRSYFSRMAWHSGSVETFRWNIRNHLFALLEADGKVPHAYLVETAGPQLRSLNTRLANSANRRFQIDEYSAYDAADFAIRMNAALIEEAWSKIRSQISAAAKKDETDDSESASNAEQESPGGPDGSADLESPQEPLAEPQDSRTAPVSPDGSPAGEDPVLAEVFEGTEEAAPQQDLPNQDALTEPHRLDLHVEAADDAATQSHHSTPRVRVEDAFRPPMTPQASPLHAAEMSLSLLSEAIDSDDAASSGGVQEGLLLAANDLARSRESAFSQVVPSSANRLCAESADMPAPDQNDRSVDIPGLGGEGVRNYDSPVPVDSFAINHQRRPVFLEPRPLRPQRPSERPLVAAATPIIIHGILARANEGYIDEDSGSESAASVPSSAASNLPDRRSLSAETQAQVAHNEQEQAVPETVIHAPQTSSSRQAKQPIRFKLPRRAPSPPLHLLPSAAFPEDDLHEIIPPKRRRH